MLVTDYVVDKAMADTLEGNDKRLFSWDMYFLSQARLAATRSKDPSTQTGAVFARGNRSISTGYNGFPALIKDTPERLNDREMKYQLIVHCEVNGANIAQENGANVAWSTLYTWPFMSCSRCAVDMISRKVMRVVAPHSTNPRWVDSFKMSTALFEEAGVDICLYSKDLLIEHFTQEAAKLDTMLGAL